MASGGFEGMRFRLVTPVGERSVAIRALGRLAVHNALAAAAAGLAAGLDLDELLPGLDAGSTAPHRSVLIRAGGVVIVDDSYNAAPGSVRAALELLAGLPGRRVAVLGELRELGSAHAGGHRAVGEVAGDTLDLLVVVDGGPGGVSAALKEAVKGLKGRETMLWVYVTSKKYKASATDGDEEAVASLRALADPAQDAGTNSFGFVGREIFPIENGISQLHVADMDGDVMNTPDHAAACRRAAGCRGGRAVC